MKKTVAFLLLILMTFSFASCSASVSEGTDTEPSSASSVSDSDTAAEESSADLSTDTSSPSTDSATDSSSAASSEASSGGETSQPVANLFLAGDQYSNQVVLYDFDQLSSGDSLEWAETWSFTVGVSHIAGLKYREDTVFGDVILVASGAGNGQAHMISYPDGTVLWSTKQAGNNPHCIEILPSGNIIVASSTGGTLRLFKTSALLTGDTATADTYEDTGLYGAHGVLWDPAYELVWGLGDDVLMSYTLSGEGVNEKLVYYTKKASNLPTDGGHCLAADFSDPNFLYVTTNTAVYRFAKQHCIYIPSYKGSDAVNVSTVKGLAHNENGNFCLTIPNGTYKDWNTDTLVYCYLAEDGTYVKESFKSEGSRAMYKITAFNGKYQ